MVVSLSFDRPKPKMNQKDHTDLLWSTYHRNQRVEVGSPVKAVEILCEKQILRVTKKNFFFTLKKCMKKYTINIVKGNYLTNSQFHQ